VFAFVYSFPWFVDDVTGWQRAPWSWLVVVMVWCDGQDMGRVVSWALKMVLLVVVNSYSNV
jgi:hypothetical protein